MITKIQNNQINYANKNNLNTNPSFKGVESLFIGGLRNLNNYPAVGACVVDLGSMVIPRTVVDMKNRGVDAGTETGIREASSTTNHALVGFVGLGAATIVSLVNGINKDYDIKANTIFANNDSIDVFSKFWNNELKGNTEEEAKKCAKEYYKSVLTNLRGLNGKQLSDPMPENIVDSIAEKLSNSKHKLTKDLKRSITSDIVKTTGAENCFEIKAGGKTLTSSIGTLLDNMTALGKAFASDKVKDIPKFVNRLKGVKTASALLGLAVTCSVGCSIQPINTHLTKKRTGKEGFVGVEGREPDKSTGFKLMKLAAAGAMGLLAYKTIGGGPKGILNKIQFSNKLPNLNQFKLIYGMTIMSRFLSARDKNELRESTTKDFLGFINWLILGGMVTKLTARAFGEEFINNPLAKDEKGIKHAWNWLTNPDVSVKTYDQMLLAGKEVIKDEEAKGFKELMKAADKVTKKQVGKLAFAQIAGYLYSGIVLGFGIAKLNIFITGKVQKSQKAKQQKPMDSTVKYYAQNNDEKKSVFEKIKALKSL